MGHLKFGNLAFIRNIIYIRISPYEQKAFPDFFANAWRGFSNDFVAHFPYAFTTLSATYLIIKWAKEENERFSRKNPKDYENDE